MNHLDPKPQFIIQTDEKGEEQVLMNLPGTVLFIADVMADEAEPLPRHNARLFVDHLLEVGEANGFPDRTAFMAAFSPERPMERRKEMASALSCYLHMDDIQNAFRLMTARPAHLN